MRTSDSMTSVVRSTQYLTLKSLLLAGTFFFLFGCGSNQNELPVLEEGFMQIRGNAQGTTYSITYQDLSQRDLRVDVDSILSEFDRQLSNYDDTSEISFFNSAPEMHFAMPISEHFIRCVSESKNVYKQSGGYFNPTVFPLVKRYGFFKEELAPPNAAELDSLLEICSFSDSNIQLRTAGGETGQTFTVLYKRDGRTQLGFNAIAQGLSVDILAEYFDDLGIINYMIEVGGELRTRGNDPYSNDWQVIIDKPVASNSIEDRQEQFRVSLINQGLATSGNYRKSKKKDGKYYVHTVNPLSGEAFASDILSATVIADKASTADAFATAFMAMGLDKTIDFLNKNESLNLKVWLVIESGGLKVWDNITSQIEA